MEALVVRMCNISLLLEVRLVMISFKSFIFESRSLISLEKLDKDWADSESDLKIKVLS